MDNDNNTIATGDFEIIYEAEDSSGNKNQATRKVSVIDDSLPSITGLDEDVTLEVNSTYIPLYEVTDNNEVTISTKLEKYDSHDDNTSNLVLVDTFSLDGTLLDQEGLYKFTVEATDNSGNKQVKSQIIYVKDTIAPTLTLLNTDGSELIGNSVSDPIILERYSTYDDPGASNEERI